MRLGSEGLVAMNAIKILRMKLVFEKRNFWTFASDYLYDLRHSVSMICVGVSPYLFPAVFFQYELQLDLNPKTSDDDFDIPPTV